MKSLVTGGAGFIGTNLVAHLLENGSEVSEVIVFDNLSRRGVEKNLEWLKGKFGERCRVIIGDVRDYAAVADAIQGADVVYHLAAQVAVTTSVTRPRLDFEVNAQGTLNVLEAVREFAPQAVVFYASTNKVYGEMLDVPIVNRDNRYDYGNLPEGVSEGRSLDFHSPYGCSKGAGDQYMVDYARIYGLKTVVFRKSCIYGYHQFGNEDQGWAAHFAIMAARGRPITIYGDGRQVRDLLFISDLLRAYDLALEGIEKTAGQVYNIGGGPGHRISLLNLIDMLEKKTGRSLEYSFAPWRPGDQKVYISNIRKARSDFGWEPETPVAAGISRLLGWVQSNNPLFA